MVEQTNSKRNTVYNKMKRSPKGTFYFIIKYLKKNTRVFLCFFAFFSRILYYFTISCTTICFYSSFFYLFRHFMRFCAYLLQMKHLRMQLKKEFAMLHKQHNKFPFISTVFMILFLYFIQLVKHNII